MVDLEGRFHLPVCDSASNHNLLDFYCMSKWDLEYHFEATIYVIVAPLFEVRSQKDSGNEWIGTQQKNIKIWIYHFENKNVKEVAVR